MRTRVDLVPMFCTRCSTPIEALPEEVLWVCENCGQAQMLDDERGLQPLRIHYAAKLSNDKPGYPFWVVKGRVVIDRATFRGDYTAESQLFWSEPRRFFIPAFNVSLEKAIEMGTDFLRNQPTFEEGKPANFQPITLLPEDIHPLCEFVVTGIEANRGDALQELYFDLSLARPELWIIP